jgi:hypothetical protein
MTVTGGREKAMTMLRDLANLALGAVLALSTAGLAAETAPAGTDVQAPGDPIGYDTGRYLGTPWASGGAGEGARQQMMNDLGDYNLRLEFAVQDGTYLGDVAVTVTRPDGGTVLRAFSSGPWLMAKLAPGTYDVRASGFGRTFDETVTVPAGGMATVVFNQWTKEGVAQASPGPFY